MTVGTAELEASLARVRALVKDPRAGLFGPGSKVWEVNRESIVFLGGGRAALLQTAHPFVAHGVDQHSRTKTDPVGRFLRTFDHVFSMVFGDLDQAFRAARRVHAIHQKIRGTIDERVGAFDAGSPYQANQEDALLWVHATLWDTSVQCFELVVRKLSAAEKEVYYEESKRFAYLFGISDRVLPPDWASFKAYNERMWESDTLGVGRPAADMGRFLFLPPAPSLSPLSRWYLTMTAGLLPPRVRHLYRLEYGALEKATFESSMRALSASYRMLPPHGRTLAAYKAAEERLGLARQGPVSRAVNRAVSGAITRAREMTAARSALSSRAMDDGVSLLWELVEERWDDKARHDAFIEYCRTTAQLPVAAARYRAVVAASAEKGAEDRERDAKKRLAAIAFLATQLLEGTRSDLKPWPPRWLTVLTGVVIFVVVLWVLWRMSKVLAMGAT